MYILGFDTSNAYTSVAITYNNDILYAKKDLLANTQAERLIIMIEEALKSTQLNYQKLNYVAVSSGPGSFTGIRIGLAAAKGISLAASNINTACVNNFQLINFRIREQYMNFDYAIAAVNANRGELFIQVFTKKGEYQPPTLLSFAKVQELIADLKGVKVLAGSGWYHLFDATKEITNDLILLPRFAYPDARFVCKVAHQQIVQQRHKSIIEPLYIRAPDAKLPSKAI